LIQPLPEGEGENWKPAAFARDVDAGSTLQLLLVSAIAAVLVTRLYLSLTGYPRMGGSGPLHIAHLLWGGLLMLVSVSILVATIGKRARRLAAVMGGVGFGLFVDELGKFITSDNDYFFQPAIALIYVVFILLFLLFRAIERESLSEHERLVNAAETLTEIVLSGATRTELARARLLVERCGVQGPLADGLREAIESATRVPERTSPISAAAAWAWRTYDRLLEWPWFHRAIWVVFVAQAVFGLIATVAVGWATLNDRTPPGVQGTLLTSALSLVLVLVGVARLPTSRLDAYRWFERSVLISVFFTQVVMFWQDQLTAVGGLFWDLALLAVLRFLIRQERARIVTQR
jgi:hypothetical protein